MKRAFKKEHTIFVYRVFQVNPYWKELHEHYKGERRKDHAKPKDRFGRSIRRATKPLSASAVQAQGKLCPCAGVGLFYRKSEGHSLDRLRQVETSQPPVLSVSRFLPIEILVKFRSIDRHSNARHWILNTFTSTPDSQVFLTRGLERELRLSIRF